MPPTPRHQIEAEVLHCCEPYIGHDKVYVVWVEDRTGDYFVCGGYGKRTIVGMLKIDPKGSFNSLDDARRAMNRIVSDKTKKGYMDVDSNAYQSKVPANLRTTFDTWINPQRIDTTRIVGLASPSQTAAAPIVTVAKHADLHAKSHGRAHRSISL